MELEKYSIGIGDRFGREGVAQLRALQHAESQGVSVVPVWNKSNREHSIIGTVPGDTRMEADEAVRACGWKSSYYVDADHIGLATVDKFISASNFFTIDVADAIGTPAAPDAIASFVDAMAPYQGKLHIPALPQPLAVTKEMVEGIARKYLHAVHQAGAVYQHVAGRKGATQFIPEVSFDEAGDPQTPVELFFILAAIAREGIPVQTIAPKFTGAFLKGIDYVGEVNRFEQEFNDDLAVIAHAVTTFHLPSNLKLSVHSGSDKFALYPVIHRALKRTNAGLHLKTAGTTWLEEVIGLAAAGGEGLRAAKEIYAASFARYDELCGPYLTVIDIDRAKLPPPARVEGWASTDFVHALQHDQSCDEYNLHFRQLVHVGYKVAAEMGHRFQRLLGECRTSIEENVSMNIFERHIRPLYIGESAK
jgi:tagaturonate epimerase